MLEGFWVNDINKTGSMTDFDRDNAPQVTQYEIPKVNFIKKIQSSKLLN